MKEILDKIAREAKLAKVAMYEESQEEWFKRIGEIQRLILDLVYEERNIFTNDEDDGTMNTDAERLPEDKVDFRTINGVVVPINKETGEPNGGWKGDPKIKKEIAEHKAEAKKNPSKPSASSSSSSSGGSQSLSKNTNQAKRNVPLNHKVEKKNVNNYFDVGDCKAQIDGGEENSMSKFMNPDGSIKPEKQAEHKKIVEDCLVGKTPNPSGVRTMTMLGGGSASGKSSGCSVQEDEHTAKIDPDDMKQRINGFKEMALKSDKTAGYYHEESSALAKSLYKNALENDIDVLYDGTGDGSPKSLMKKINQAREAGYQVNAEYSTVGIDEALQRNKARYEHALKKFNEGKADTPPRLVNDEEVIRIHRNVTDCLVACAGEFDNVVLMDNNVPRGQPKFKIAEATRGGRLKAVKGKEKDLQAFLDKGNKKYTIDAEGYVKEVE